MQPNSMQVGFITNLKRILDANENNDKALLISATGADVIIKTGRKNLILQGIRACLKLCPEAGDG